MIVAITDASGEIYDTRLLAHLRAAAEIGTHVVVSHAGALNAHHELGRKRNEIKQMADQTLARVLDLLPIEHGLAPRWGGI